MKLVSLATGRWGPSMVMFLCPVLPGPLIRRLGRWLAGYFAHRDDLPLVRALRANMAVVYGLPEAHPAVRQAVAQLLGNAILSYADFFRMVQTGHEGTPVDWELDPSMRQAIEESLATGRGMILVGAHMCSFDILLLALKEVLPDVQILTNADPQGSSRVMNEIRQEQGLHVTPLSVHSIRQALERLDGGGVVAVAADIPIEGGEELTFFGRTSQLPVGHARLALRTGANILVGASYRVGEGAYRAEVALAPRPESTGDRKGDVARWAQTSLNLLESYIRKWPEEWLMPIPVWPG